MPQIREQESKYSNIAMFWKQSLILHIRVKKLEVFPCSSSTRQLCTQHTNVLMNFQHFRSPGVLSFWATNKWKTFNFQVHKLCLTHLWSKRICLVSLSCADQTPCSHLGSRLSLGRIWAAMFHSPGHRALQRHCRGIPSAFPCTILHRRARRLF